MCAGTPAAAIRWATQDRSRAKSPPHCRYSPASPPGEQHGVVLKEIRQCLDHASKISIALRAYGVFVAGDVLLELRGRWTAFALAVSSCNHLFARRCTPREMMCANGCGLKSSDEFGSACKRNHADFHGSSPALTFAFMNSRSAWVCKIPG